MKKRVLIQGHEGSFHHQAASHYFKNDALMVPCKSFQDLVGQIGDPSIGDAGLMAIENSIAGSIMGNYTLLQKSSLQITGEIFLAIRLHLMVFPGTKLSDIREVHSHSVALMQCLPFLESYPDWKRVEAQDTAYSARYIHQKRSKHKAAVASELAAKHFGLKILKGDIQATSHNYTRFLILEPKKDENFSPEANKCSVYFEISNEKGRLASILELIAHNHLNLTKIQSLPVPIEEWKYGFHVDMEFDHPDQFYSIFEVLNKMTQHLQVFGIYSKGKTY